MTAFYFFDVFCGTLYMLFFACVFCLYAALQGDGYAAIFKFKPNSFYVHVLTYIVLPSSNFFCPLLSNLFSMYADLGKNKMID